jgi:spore germination cell wall hydrolase CwlJ-like protein
MLSRADALHMAGAQLVVGAVMSAGLAMAAVPAHQTNLRAMSAIVPQPTAAEIERIQAQVEAQPVDVIRLQDLTPDQARAWNKEQPFAKGPNPAARPFHLETAGVLDEAHAIDCMTAAVYYEAGEESADGQRAVAQVVINRLRHPIFPKTVCGVVFQGADRKTGCQFTFTCDGALARTPSEEGWARARAVAQAALEGSVMKKVGNATHYHAVYVAPYWSPTLLKVSQVGAHIFYRWTGGSGLPPAFAGAYAGGETGQGVKMATIDKLGAIGPKLAMTAPPPAAVAAQAPRTVIKAAPEAPKEAQIVVAAATVAKDAAALVQLEDLDWKGEPKAKSPPHVATPVAAPVQRPATSSGLSPIASPFGR